METLLRLKQQDKTVIEDLSTSSYRAVVSKPSDCFQGFVEVGGKKSSVLVKAICQTVILNIGIGPEFHHQYIP